MTRRFAIMAFAAVLPSAGSDMAAHAATPSEGWDNVNPARAMPPPVQETWRAPVEKGAAAFDVEWRDGAAGSFTVSNGAIRIEKTNDLGSVVVTAPFDAPPGSVVQGFAACHAEKAADPLDARACLRLWSGKEGMSWQRRLFGATATDSPVFRQLVNTPPGHFTRKLCRGKADASGRMTAAIVVEGPSSVTVWRGWGAEDAAAADKEWRARACDGRKPPDRSGTMADEAVFDAALAADKDHSAKIVKTPSGGRLEVDGVPAPPVLYKPIPFGMGVPFTGEGRMFEQAGVDLQVVNIRLGAGHGRIGFWTKDGFDCAGAVKRVKDFMRSAPRSLFMVTLRCDAYPEYADEHPSEKWLRRDGSEVWGGCSQGEKKAPARPTPNTWPWVSNHSIVWRADVKRLMTRFVDELKRTGLSKRIVGVHLAGYHDGQFAVPVADFSKPALAAFRRWQEKEFGSVRWPGVPAFPPDRELLDTQTDAAAVAYQKFMKWGPMEMQEDFARHLKAAFGKPVVVGRWCMTPYGASVMATLDFTPFVRSQALDFLVAQPVYDRRTPGVACGVRVPLASFRAHGKLFINEFDTRTWHGRSGSTEARGVFLSEATDLPMWETIHRKLSGQMLANGMGWWYFDMADNWFDEPSIMAEISRTIQAIKDAKALDGLKIADVAVVLDEEGLLLRNRVGNGLSMREVRNTPEQLQTLAAASVPFDIVLARDLLDGSVRGTDYKALVMAGFYNVDAPRARLVSTLKAQGVRLLFLADSGACGGAAAIDGFEKISEPGGLSHRRFNEFAKSAGCYVPARPGLQVDMNGTFVSLHCLESGHYDFMLPFPADVVNVKTGLRLANTKDLSLKLVGGETRWYTFTNSTEGAAP